MAVAAARPALPPQEPLQRPEPAGRRPCAEESAGRGAAPPPRLQPPPPPPRAERPPRPRRSSPRPPRHPNSTPQYYHHRPPRLAAARGRGQSKPGAHWPRRRAGPGPRLPDGAGPGRKRRGWARSRERRAGGGCEGEPRGAGGGAARCRGARPGRGGRSPAGGAGPGSVSDCPRARAGGEPGRRPPPSKPEEAAGTGRTLLPFQACVGEDCCAPVSVRPGDSSPRLMKGKNTGVCCHFFFRGSS
nr:translation initiation factor IF-2-like [Ovis aries]